MERLHLTPRVDAATKLEAQGFSFHRDYWREDACYRFSRAEIEEIEDATAVLHALCLEALDALIAARRFRELAIPAAFHAAIAESFARGDFSLYGRFDLAYDGRSPPKLLEYNADTPTSALETAVCQWFWLEECRPADDQFNSLHEKLVARWRALPGSGPVHFAAVAGCEEDWVNVAYLMDTAVQAGCETVYIDLERIGWDAACGCFVDEDARPIARLFKLYPWEWMMRDEFGAHVAAGGTQFIEPAWKAVLSCKGFLALLWELFPHHPNLLETRFSPGPLTSYAKKPLYSREGANVELVRDGRVVARDDGPYGAEGHVYQRLCPLPAFDGRYPVIGSWLVGGEPAGMCVREDATPITTNASHFVPHYFTN